MIDVKSQVRAVQIFEREIAGQKHSRRSGDRRKIMSETLYRFYAKDGQLLYVGVTMNPPDRFKDHRHQKEWWPMVSGITMETYDSRAAVLDAERRAIKIEHPKYNVQHNGRKPAATSEPTTRQLIWMCEACHRPIASGEGYVWVSWKEVHDAELAIKEWNATIDGPFLTAVDLHNIPHGARWHVHHAKCDPDPNSADYWSAVERLDTWEEIFDFLAHILEKDWVREYTQIQNFVRSIPRRFGR
jgi:hypothetical protein